MLWSLILWNFFSECCESLIISGMCILTKVVDEKKISENRIYTKMQ